MDKKTQKQLEEKYLRASYLYYYRPDATFEEGSMLDSDFDKLRDKLINETDSKVPNFVEFPSMSELKELNLDLSNILDSKIKDQTEYPHKTPMLSIEKIQVNDENDFSEPLHAFQLFQDRIAKNGPFEATSKYDGNGIECLYDNGKLIQVLTRGTKLAGFDKTNKVKHIIPNEIPLKGFTEVRGEIVIDVKLWSEKYEDKTKVQNPRNYVAGVLNRDEYNINEINDLVFVAYSLVNIENGNKSYPENSQELLYEIGFNQKYKPFVYKFNNISEFKNVYYEYKKYRDEICPFLLDGIVIKFPEAVRNRLGENHHHPKWCVAIKFPPSEVSTDIIDIVWTQGKNREFAPVAILKPIELDGVVVRRASLHNMGYIINNRLFPGAKVVIAKKGEIIPQIVGIISASTLSEEYMKQYNNFKLNQVA